MKWTKQIHNLQKTLVWDLVDRGLIVEVWPLRRSELDRLFYDRIIDERHYLSHLEEEDEDGKLVACLWLPILILGRLCVSSELGLCLG